MSGTKRFVEQRILKNRQEEAKSSDLKRMLVEHNILAGHGKSDSRVEDKRRARSAAAERRDLFMDYSYTQAEQEKERRARICQFEENLADEMARRKAEALREEMRRRSICDGSEELRTLKERLHAAKVNKERAQQLLHLEVQKESQRMHDHRIAEHMENERQEHEELDHKLNLEKLKQRERVKTINQQQIASKEAQRQEALQEYIKERDEVEALVGRIAREDAEELQAREEKKAESQKLLKEFMIDQRRKQEATEQAERDEFEKIEQYAREKREREERLAAEAAVLQKEKDRVLKAMLGVAEAASKEKEELERLRNDLHTEQAEAEHRRREELVMRKKLEDKQEMQNAYLYQMHVKDEIQKKGRAEEDRVREALLRKFAEDDRIEQMNDHKRRLKVEQHKREADRLVGLRREMFDAARDQERSHQDGLKQDESSRQSIIEAERQRLLKEHAVVLRDFLPKYTLETKEDYDFVFAGASGHQNGGYPVDA